jgi:DNA-directed RNA polymerase subunit RPC12/RpoP
MRVIIRIQRDRKTRPATAPPAAAADVDLRGVWCLSCGSRYVRNSRRRGLLDRLLFVFGYLPFRCLTCGRRFRFRAPRRKAGSATAA